MPQGQYNFTGSGIGQTVGRYGLGGIGAVLGGPIGGLLGRAVGGPLGGLVGGGLSTLFGPRGLPAAVGSGFKGLSMLTGQLGGQQGGVAPYTGPNNLFGANAPAPTTTTGGYTGAAPIFSSVNPAAAPAGTPSYGRFQSLIGSNAGTGAFASNISRNIASRNLI